MADPSADNLKILNDGAEVKVNPEALDFSDQFSVILDDSNPTNVIVELADDSVGQSEISEGGVGRDNIEDEAVNSSKLSEDLQPSHVIKFAGLTASETDNDASVVASVEGVLDTDVVLATILAQAGTATILKAVPTTDTITFTLSGNGGAGTRIQYAVLREIAG